MNGQDVVYEGITCREHAWLSLDPVATVSRIRRLEQHDKYEEHLRCESPAVLLFLCTHETARLHMAIGQIINRTVRQTSEFVQGSERV
jgi:hypothetical protein